jgi:hypothetical protein
MGPPNAKHVLLDLASCCFASSLSSMNLWGVLKCVRFARENSRSVSAPSSRGCRWLPGPAKVADARVFETSANPQSEHEKELGVDDGVRARWRKRSLRRVPEDRQET